MASFFKILLVIALLPVLLVSLWDPNWFKTDIDQQLEQVSYVDLQFDYIDHSLIQPGKMSIHNIELDGELIKGSIPLLHVSVAVSSLLNKQLIVKEIKLVNPALQVNMAAIKAMSEQPNNAVAEENTFQSLPIQSAELQRFIIENAHIMDVSEPSLFAIKGLNLRLSDLQLVKNNRPITPETLPPVAIELTINKTVLTGQSFGKLLINTLGNGQQLTLNQFQMVTEQSNINLNGKVNNPLKSPVVSLTIDESVVALDEFDGLMGDLPIKPAGVVNLIGKLQEFAVSNDTQHMLQNLNGNLHIGLDNGIVRGIDINQMVQTIKDSRNTKDLGFLLLKNTVKVLDKRSTGSSWTRAALNHHHQTAIPQLRVNSTLTNGMLNLQHTAFATDQYRVAINGAVDMDTVSFNDFTFSILNAAGCADVQQTLNGNLDNPTHFLTKNLAANIINPLESLFENFVKPASACQPVYQGEVLHPN